MAFQFDHQRFMTELRETPEALYRYVRNPVEGIRKVPDWSWPTLMAVQGLVSLAAGATLGLIGMSVWDFLLGLVLFPPICVISSLIVTLFLSYFFSIFHSTYLEFRRLYTVVVLANLPFLIFHALSSLVPPIDLIGFAFTCVLLLVGLTEQFVLERKLVMRLIIGLYLVFFLVWSTAQVRNTMTRDKYEEFMRPESLDKLEQDVKKED